MLLDSISLSPIKINAKGRNWSAVEVWLGPILKMTFRNFLDHWVPKRKQDKLCCNGSAVLYVYPWRRERDPMHMGMIERAGIDLRDSQTKKQ